VNYGPSRVQISAIASNTAEAKRPVNEMRAHPSLSVEFDPLRLRKFWRGLLASLALRDPEPRLISLAVVFHGTLPISNR